METFVVDHGLKGCFDIVTKDTQLNAFRHFGLTSEDMAQEWINDVLKNGVRSTVGSSARHKLCPCDADNMEISGNAILDSCSTALKRTIKREPPVKARNGDAVFFAAIHNGRTHKNANVRSMCNNSENLDLRKCPGENVLAFVQDAMDRVDEIGLAAQSDSNPDNLTQIAIQGLSLGSDEGLCSEVRLLIKAAAKPDSKIALEHATKELAECHIDVNLHKACGPANAKPPQAFQVRTPTGHGNGGGQGNPGGRGGGERGNGSERS